MRWVVVGIVAVGFLTMVGCDSEPAPPPPTITVQVTRAKPIPTLTPVPPPATATAVPAPTLVPTAPAVLTETPIPFFVGKTNGDGIWLRAAPPDGNKLKALPDGTKMVVIGPDQNVGGKVWKNVRDPGGSVGWVTGEFLVTEAEVTPVAVPTKAP